MSHSRKVKSSAITPGLSASVGDLELDPLEMEIKLLREEWDLYANYIAITEFKDDKKSKTYLSTMELINKFDVRNKIKEIEVEVNKIPNEENPSYSKAAIKLALEAAIKQLTPEYQ